MSNDAKYKTTGNMFKEAEKLRNSSGSSSQNGNGNGNGNGKEQQEGGKGGLNGGMMPGKVNVLSTEYDVAAVIGLSNKRLVVIDVFAEWCQPCKRIEGDYLKLAQETSMQNAGVLFFKTDLDNPQLQQVTGDVVNVPTFKIYKGGNVVAIVIGTKLDQLRQKIQALM